MPTSPYKRHNSIPMKRLRPWVEALQKKDPEAGELVAAALQKVVPTPLKEEEIDVGMEVAAFVKAEGGKYVRVRVMDIATWQVSGRRSYAVERLDANTEKGKPRGLGIKEATELYSLSDVETDLPPK